MLKRIIVSLLLSPAALLAHPLDPDCDCDRTLYDSSNLEEILDTEVQSVSKIGESLAKTPARVTVYTRADLDRLKPRNLADLLELTSGFLIGRDVDDISIGSRGVVTDSNQKFMIAIDGHRVSNNNNFGVNPFHETRNLINIAERIEIVRGSGGELWGPDAFQGLINIVTRRPNSKEKTTEAGIIYGPSDDTVAANIAHLESLASDVGVSIFADVIHSSGEEISTRLAGQGGADRPGSYNERYESPTVSMNARIDAGMSWVSGQAVNLVSPVEGARQEEEYSQLFIEAGRRVVIDESSLLTLRLYGDRFDHERRSLDDDSEEIFSSTPETRLGGEAVLATQWTDAIRTVAGWDSRYYRYSGGSVGTLDPDAISNSMGILAPREPFPTSGSAVGDYTWNGVFGEGVVTGEKWDFHAGLRYDTFSDEIDDLYSPRAALGFYPAEDVSVKLLFSRGALRPSWTQLSGFFSFQGKGPQLEPEESYNYEVLVDWAYSDLFTSLSLYHSHYDDTISYVNTANGPGYENYADYTTTGLEWDNRVRFGDLADLFFNLTWYLDVQREEKLEILAGNTLFALEGSQVRPGTDDPYNIPDVFFTAGSTFHLPIGARVLDVTPIFRYIGERFVQGRDGVPDRKIDSLYVDLKAGMSLTESASLSLVAKNIFDNDDAVGIARGIPGLVIPKGPTWELRVDYRF